MGNSGPGCVVKIFEASTAGLGNTEKVNQGCRVDEGKILPIKGQSTPQDSPSTPISKELDLKNLYNTSPWCLSSMI